VKRDLGTNDTETAEVINQYLLLLCLYWKDLPSAIPDPETRGKAWKKDDLPLLEENQVRKHLNELNIHKHL